jgi:hypothetical protein
VDSTGYNNKMMVQQMSDSYYLLINFKQFYQSGANVKIESVIFKQSYNINLSGMYSCHAWTPVTSPPTVGVTITASAVTSVLVTGNILGQTIMQWNSLITIDN